MQNKKTNVTRVQSFHKKVTFNVKWPKLKDEKNTPLLGIRGDKWCKVG